MDARRQAKGSRIVSPSFEGYGGDHTENLYEMRNKLSWGDLASMAIAMEILTRPFCASKYLILPIVTWRIVTRNSVVLFE